MSKRLIFFIRHGRTDWNDSSRFQGRTDVPLNDAGRAQAASLAARMRDWRGTVLYSSTMSRAFETAQILSANCGGLIEPREGLVEMGFGDWEGRTFMELEKSATEHFHSWRANPFGNVPQGGETFEAIRARLKPVLDEVLREDAARVAVVSHGGVIRAALCMLLNLSGETAWRMRLGNCSVTGIEKGRRGISLLFLNDGVHTLVGGDGEAFLPSIPFCL